jgi:phosphoenolpyruvate carboxykinase (ATP)
MLLINGYIGKGPNFRVGCQLFIEQSQANIAAMQQQLFFPSGKDFIPKFSVVYTPTLTASGFPNDRLIAVDIENFTTRIIGTDYFGESKKGVLRMWNKLVYDQGGLALHAGCKVWPNVEGRHKLALIIGLSGTGKTTTTFREQLGSLPVQDDFCALLPLGVIYSSENGCFAKTFGLKPNEEPVLFHALAQPDAWLKNVAVTKEGNVDFLDGNRTTNGRGTFQLEKIPHFNPINLPRVDYIFILNRNFDILPAVAKLKPEQAAAYFMLGEITDTSAGGKSEENKFLRVPGTNPFFTEDDALQGNRFLELLKTIPYVSVFLLNTGRIGGMENDPRSKKVSIQHSSAIQDGIVRNNISWREDPDFGYFIADTIPSFNDPELLKPKLLYQRQNRDNEYMNILRKLKHD